MSALLAGWMPWLPPTPKPTGGPVRIRDRYGVLQTPVDPEMASQKGESPKTQRPWRKVTRTLNQERHGAHLTCNIVWTYLLECGHEAIRRQKLEKTTCGVCPRERR